jgi:hypothetical protein
MKSVRTLGLVCCALVLSAFLGPSHAEAQKGVEADAEAREEMQRLAQEEERLEAEMQERLLRLQEIEEARRAEGAAAEAVALQGDPSAAEEQAAGVEAAALAEEAKDRATRWRRSRPDRGEDQKFALGGTARVRSGETASEVFALGGQVLVEVDGEVEGSAVAVLGTVTVNGRVRGDVVSVGGDVELGSEARVGGDVTSVGGKVIQEDGAEIDGKVSEAAVGVDLGDLDLFPRGPNLSRLSQRGLSSLDDWFGLFWSLVMTGCYVILCGLLVLVAPRAVDNVRRTVSRDTWKCALLGLAIGLLVVPATVVIVFLLVVSIIGIPFLILVPFVYLFLIAAGLFGLAGTAIAVGRALKSRFGLGYGTGLIALVVGLVALRGLGIVGDFFDAIGMPWVVHGMFGLAGFLVWFAASCVALGGVFLSRLGQSGPPELPPLPRL